jgi:hypothetical protein
MKKFDAKKVLIISLITIVVISIAFYVIYTKIVDKPKGMDYKEDASPGFGFGLVNASSKNRLKIKFFKG